MGIARGKVMSFVLLVLLINFVSVVSAQSFPDYTNKYVNDFGNVLDSVQTGELRGIFEAVDRDTTAEIVFISVSDLQGYDISQYAIEIGHKWGVGKEDKDNGIVILYATDVKRIYVAVGYGVEGILPDSKIGRLLDENYVPLRDSGDVSGGIVETGKALAKVVIDNKAEVLSGQSAGGKRDSNWIIISIFFFVLIIVVSFITLYTRKAIATNKNTMHYLYSKDKSVGYKSTTDKNQKFVKMIDIVVFIFISVLFLMVAETLGIFGFIIFIMLYVWLSNLIAKIFPKSCAKDGERLKFWKKENGKNYYKCEHGHILALSVVAAGAGAMYGGMGGGSSGGFSGGGGFGGGGFGGGGAGR